MKAAIQKAYALDTPPECEAAGPDAWSIEGAARFANRLLWSALMDVVAVEQAGAAGRPISAEKQELADDACVWIAGAQDCRVTFDMCVELLFSSDIPDLADRLREAIEAEPARVLTLVAEAMREAEYEAARYSFMQRTPVDDAAPQTTVDQVQEPDPGKSDRTSNTGAAELMIDLPPLPVPNTIEVRALAGGQYLLPLFDSEEDLEHLASADDYRSAPIERLRGM
ncbi:hypothetical protein [Cupriavidus necator]|uniref:hypothetical protein n=1 Tax=Cupriavidus necator TaxID=106590 RepID=UPI000A54750C|nr:hypothetical protein [Cupriavidus necator]